MDRSPYISSPGKRTAAGAMSLSNKRFKPQQNHHPLPTAHVCFRILSHSSRVGGVIGKSGTIIKQLQQQTGAKIRIEEAPADCPDRVISVVAPGAIPTSDGGEIDVSKGQEALVRVFERILEVAAETDGGDLLVGRIVSCRLLAERSHAGSVIGRGGQVVEKIKRDCEVKIKVMNDKVPLCADSTEEMIEIEGEVTGVKKALVAVSRCLQDSQLSDRTRMNGSRTVDMGPRDSLPEARLDVLSQHTSLQSSIPSISTSYTSGSHSRSAEYARKPNLEMRMLPEEVAFRILCPSSRVGGVIGKNGSTVRALQEETGATVTIGPTVPDCDEQLITLAASEIPDSQHSAAQKATVLVFSRCVDGGFEKGLEDSPITVRMVVSSNHVGCLLGKGGAIVSEMRKVTGASIRILGRDQLPKCVEENDQVVQISGELARVRDAIYHITGRLRDNLFSGLPKTSVTRRTPLSPERKPYESLWNPPNIPLRDLSRDSFKEPFTDPYRNPSWEQSRESFTDLYRYHPEEPMRESFREPMRESFREPLRESFMEPLRDPYRDPLGDSSRDRLRDPAHLSIGASHSSGRHSYTGQSMDRFGVSNGYDQPPSPKSWTTQMTNGVNTRGFTDVSRGLSSFKGGLEMASKSAIVTNTTVEILVPESVIGCVYGEGGNNLLRLRQISGAKVIVHEPRVGSSDRIVLISGTPDETHAAQSLLQAFILTGQT